MAVIAIAGGGGRLALTIAEVLKENPKHKVFILSRKVRLSVTTTLFSSMFESSSSKTLQAAETQDPKAPVIVVDYTDVSALSQMLEANAVTTVISTLQVNTQVAGASEINLVKAASQSVHTKRFISSDWSIPVHDA